MSEANIPIREPFYYLCWVAVLSGRPIYDTEITNTPPLKAIMDELKRGEENNDYTTSHLVFWKELRPGELQCLDEGRLSYLLKEGELEL